MSKHTDETLLISFRSIKERLSESLLLIIGIALGIGAAAAGLALVINSQETAEQMLQLPQYREIIVSAKEQASSMENPVQRLDDSEEITLSVNDLDAAAELPNIQTGYLSTQVMLELGDMSSRMPLNFQQENRTSNTENNSLETDQLSETNEQMENMRPPEDQDFEMVSQEDITSPEPLLDELWAYQVTENFFPAWNLYASKGSLITEEDISNRDPVAVLGSSLAKTLFEDGESLGRQFISRNKIYTIIGILQETETETDSQAFINADIGDTRQGFEMNMRNGSEMKLYFTVSDSTQLDLGSNQLYQWFSNEYGENNISLSIPRDEAEAAIDRNNRLVIIVLFLSIAGLLIAVVNVSNILMGRSVRKTKSVGIMKALGATKKDIFFQFATEALLLSILGALLGLIISWVFSKVMEESMNTGSINPLFLIIGVLCGLFITLIFTVIPAVQASKINPAEAIKTE